MGGIGGQAKSLSRALPKGRLPSLKKLFPAKTAAFLVKNG
jgi:hypothetical protein